MSEMDDIPREGNKVRFRDNGCFVCGKENPIGLHLNFELDRENHRAKSSVTFGPEHQGWDGVVHGGLLSSVLDDVMAYAIMTTDNLAITTRLSTTYRKPVKVGETLFLEGSVDKIGSRTAKTCAVGYVIIGENSDNADNREIKVEAEGIYYLDHPTGDEERD
jgi:acyl-coenzyme A thioesterase PaaI-like protein